MSLAAELRELAEKTKRIKRPKLGGCGGCGKFKRILKGLSTLTLNRILGKEPKKWATRRLAICIECPHRTWMKKLEWGLGYIKKEDLPINHEKGENDVLWCSICKCCIEAKILVEKEKCPKNKWKVEDKVREPKGENIFSTRGGLTLNLEDHYKDSSVFIICNGPSFAKIDHSLLKQPGIITFGMNNGAHIFRPNLWITGDSPKKFMDSIWEDPTITKFIPYKFFGRQHGAGKMIGRRPNIIGYVRNYTFKPETWLTENSVNWGESSRRKGNRCIMMAAMRVAHLLGFKRMYLLGADFHMTKDKKYFFDEYRSEGSINSNNRLYKNVTGYLEKLAPIFEEAGIQVFNCNESSALKVFPYKSLEEAIAENVIDTSESTYGRYTNAPDKGPRISKEKLKEKFIIIAFYTKDTPYEEEIKNLIASLEKEGLDNHEIVPVENRGSWKLNSRQCPEIIKAALDKYRGRSVLYVDADAIFHSFPWEVEKLIDNGTDMAVWWPENKKRQLSAGTLYFANSKHARTILDKIIETGKTLPETVSGGDQPALRKIIYKIPGKIAKLPGSYLRIFDRTKGELAVTPVIEHMQASRRFKRIING